jgi:hypothetical protein
VRVSLPSARTPIRGQIVVVISARGDLENETSIAGTSAMTDVKPLDVEENPSWVLELPDAGDLPPPVETHEQELPFGKNTWQNFERLCLRLAGTDGDVEYCRLYGTEGREQGGIDIYVRRRSTIRYATWQSKRHKSFSPGQIEAAVTDFLDGDWAAKSDRFVLCVQATLRSSDATKKLKNAPRSYAIGVSNFYPSTASNFPSG